MNPPEADLRVGHPSRRTAALALVTMAAAAVTFVAFALLTTQVKTVRAGSPWQDDPYDLVVSFTALFVPGLAVLAAARVLLWQRDRPLPVGRVDGLLRAATVTGFLIAVTVATDPALAAGADHQLYNRLTPVSIIALTIVIASLCPAAIAVRHARRKIRRYLVTAQLEDWLADLQPAAARLTGWVPSRPRRTIVGLLARVAQWPQLPCHLPGITGATVLTLAGCLVVGNQAIREGLPVSLFAFETLFFVTTTYAGLVLLNSYLHLVALPAPTTNTGRAARTAVILGCLGAIVAFAIGQALSPGHLMKSIAQFWYVTYGGAAATALIAFFLALQAPPHEI